MKLNLQNILNKQQNASSSIQSYKKDFINEVVEKYIYRVSLEGNYTMDDKLFRSLQTICFKHGIAALHLYEGEWIPVSLTVMERDYNARATKGILFSPYLKDITGKLNVLYEGKIMDLTNEYTIIYEFSEYDPEVKGYNNISGIDKIDNFATTYANFYNNLDIAAAKTPLVNLANLDAEVVERINSNIKTYAKDPLTPALSAGAVKLTDEIDEQDIPNQVDLTNAFVNFKQMYDTSTIIESVKQVKNLAFSALGIRHEIEYKKERLISSEVEEGKETFRRSEFLQQLMLNRFLDELYQKTGEFIYFNSEVEGTDENTNTNTNTNTQQKGLES